MVSFLNQGRLGNFLFQAATALSYSIDHELEFCTPTSTKDPFWNPIYLHHLAKTLPKTLPVYIQEYGHEFQEIPYEVSWRPKNIILKGYWQTEKYFLHNRDKILEAFKLPWQPLKGRVSIHVRRGDYLQYPDKHPAIGAEYYTQGIKYFIDLGYTDFVVCSDDIPWCKANFERLQPAASFTYSEGNPPLQDVVLLSCCEHHISSSSTFGWWGAWLNKNEDKIIVTPKEWFVEGHGGLNTKDIIPEKWIKL